VRPTCLQLCEREVEGQLLDVDATLHDIFCQYCGCSQAKQQLVGSFKTDALRAAKEKESKEKLAYLEKQVGHLTRENRQLGSKVNQLGFLLSQAFAASQGKTISKVNLAGNEEGQGGTASGNSMALPPNSPPDKPTTNRQIWAKISTNHKRTSAVNALSFGARTQHAGSTDAAVAGMFGKQLEDQQEALTDNLTPVWRQQHRYLKSAADAGAVAAAALSRHGGIVKPMSSPLGPRQLVME
jgi:hypothetical protein